MENMYTMQAESSRETGNWAYVVRDHEGRRVLATGCRSLAVDELSKHNGSEVNCNWKNKVGRLKENERWK